MLDHALTTAPTLGPALAARETASVEPREATIRRAERQLLILDRMAELGMELAEALQRRAVAEALARTLELAPRDIPAEVIAEPAGRALRKDPGETFVRVTRAVRLTMAMQMSLEKTIRELREAPVADHRDGANDHEAGSFQAYKHQLEINDGTRPERVRDLVWDVINHEVTDVYKAHEILSALHERLIESETYDEFLFRPLRDGVEAVCADLGLTPDWSRWTGEGWKAPTTRFEWQNVWEPDPPSRPPRTGSKPKATANSISSG